MLSIQTPGLLLPIAAGSRHLFFAVDISNRTILYLNPAFSSALEQAGMPADLQKIVACLHPEDKEYIQGQYASLLQEGALHDIEFRLQFPGLPARWVSATAFTTTSATGQTLISGYLENVTAIKENAENMNKYVSKKDAILNVLSHDLAGPLGSIHNLTTLLERKARHYEDEQMFKMLLMMDRISKKAIRLINDFVQLEFMESAGTPLITKRIDLVEKFREMLFEYQNPENVLPVNVRFECEHPHIFTDIDEGKFFQAINNLISNAIKFTPDQGVISIKLEEKPASVLITVKDTGIGIPESFHDTLFDKFSQARRTGLKGEPSVGLGMSIIKTIVEWHGGRIWFRSRENEGSAFFIELPLPLKDEVNKAGK